MPLEYQCYDNFDICEDYLSNECKETCPFALRMERYGKALSEEKVKSRFRTGLERFVEKYGLNWRKSKEVKHTAPFA